MKAFLHIQGYLLVARDQQIIQELIELAKTGAGSWLKATPVALDAYSIKLEAVEETLSPGEEHEFLEFLHMLGEKYPGKISGEFEVWWPMAVESGPQWWQLDKDGKLYITESDIIRGERAPYDKA
jgi:hypothetical protein